MSETVLSLEDAAAGLGELVERVRTRQDSAVITIAGEPVARIVPLPGPIKQSEDLIAFLRRWRNQYPEPDELFPDAIKESRQTVRPPHDPWD
jgi:prevent-host-death family protein